jgi:AbrB family looped-hinge helix DNA binding protein
MHLSQVTHKGQITIPASIRKEMDITEGDKVEFERVGDQILIKLLKKVDIMSLFGSMPSPSKSLTIDEMKEIIKSSAL